MVTTTNKAVSKDSLLGKQVLFRKKVCIIASINLDNTVKLEQMAYCGMVFHKVDVNDLYFI